MALAMCSFDLLEQTWFQLVKGYYLKNTASLSVKRLCEFLHSLQSSLRP